MADRHRGVDPSTDVRTAKTACLTKTGKGMSEDLIGLFDMRVGYTVCILADPDAGDGVCL